MEDGMEFVAELVAEVDALCDHGVQRGTACAMVADRFGVSMAWLDDLHWSHMLVVHQLVLDTEAPAC